MLAEEEGFEPSIQYKLYTGFRVRRIRPLCHPSACRSRYSSSTAHADWQSPLFRVAQGIQGCFGAVHIHRLQLMVKVVARSKARFFQPCNHLPGLFG